VILLSGCAGLNQYQTRNYLQKYVDGINAYIENRVGGHHRQEVLPSDEGSGRPLFTGEKRYWWFSQKAVAQHTVSVLALKPSK
jgi:hypothetical protein